MALIISINVGCKKSNENPERSHSKTEKPNEITVITNSDDPNNPIYISKLKSFENYMDYEIETAKSKDTFKLKWNDYNLLMTGTKKTFIDSLILQAGDTLLLSLKNDILVKDLKSKNLQDWSLNSISNFSNSTLVKETDSLYNTLIKVDFSNPLILSLKNYKVKTFRLIPIDKDRAKDLLPLLVEKYSGLLYNIRWENRGSNTVKEQFLNNLTERKIFDNLLILNYYFNSPEVYNLLASSTFLSDSVANPYNEYHYLSKLLYYNVFNSKLSSSNSKKINTYRDYDSIPIRIKDTWQEKTKMIYLENMARSNKRVNDFKRKFDEFNQEYDNQVFKNYIQNKYLVDLKELYKSPLKVNLVDSKDKINNLDRLIKSLKGKVIYIDYWASWCGPCRKAMPASQELRNTYKNQEIEFIYFSVDNNKEDWLKASKTENLNVLDHNYLVLNHHESNLKNKLKINRIPKYLIYNKNGELIDHDAPGPNTKEIKEILDELLME